MFSIWEALCHKLSHILTYLSSLHLRDLLFTCETIEAPMFIHLYILLQILQVHLILCCPKCYSEETYKKLKVKKIMAEEELSLISRH